MFFSTGRNAEYDHNYQTVTLCNCKHDYFTQYCFLHWRGNKKPNKFLNQPAPGSVLTWQLCLRAVLVQPVRAELLPAAPVPQQVRSDAELPPAPLPATATNGLWRAPIHSTAQPATQQLSSSPSLPSRLTPLGEAGSK